MTTPPANAAPTDALSSAASAPTFLLGSVRSGTTLLRLMLDHHPQVAFHFEFEFAVDRLGENGDPPALEDYHDYLAQDRIFKLSGGVVDPALGYQQLVHSFLEQKRARDGKPHVGATVHHRFEHLPGLWPNARYVHLIRDGRDVARSCIAMGWAGNLYTGVDRWVRAEESWARLVEKVPADRRFEVRYEDLVRRPRETLTDICRFIGVEFDEAIFRYAEEGSYGLPDASLLEQWRRKLSDRDVQIAESRIGDMLVERGYELSGLPRLVLTEGEKRRLAWQDWWRRARFRQKRYGSLLFATDYLARKCRLPPLAMACKRLTDEIDNKHLR